MPTTRSSARKAGGSSPAPSTSTTGSKRKATDASPPAAKKGKRGAPKKQKTLQETMPDPHDNKTEGDEHLDAEMKDADLEVESEDVVKTEPTKDPTTDTTGGEEKGAEGNTNGEKTEPEPASKTDDAPQEKEETKTQEVPTEGDAVEISAEREKTTPSSILEKGIIYFFFRGRVGIDEPSDVNEIARSYIVLRPIPHGAKLGEGPMGDNGKVRVLALPKKVLPAGPKDRFMVFVDKANSNLEDIKKEFLSASDYTTKTAGVRHTPPAAPIGEGVYAITTTGRESHIAYILTLPSEINEVQKDIGLQQRGSFVTSLKNPQYEGPANAQLPEGPKFPQEILDEFRSLRWMPVQPKHLDYENAQILLIGHKDHGLDKASVPQKEDQQENKDEPKEEMEKLEHEDEIRVEHLKGDDTVFEDLNISAKEYPSLQTTW